MCGIVGFITNETKKLESDRRKFMRQGLIIDTLRGDDSTGAFAVGHEQLFDDGTAYWLKQLGAGHEFVESKGYYESLYDTTPYRAMVGHNRAATIGGVSTSTAHPFQEGPITLVHNGTLKATHNLPTPMHRLRTEHDVEVDSHAIAWNLANHDVAEVVEELDGAFALVWHDARDNSVNIIRNKERPLHMALSKQQDTMFFASEGPMLDFLDKRITLSLSSIYYPKEGQHLKWLPDSPLDAPEVVTRELYSAPSYSRYGGYDWHDDDDHYGVGYGSQVMNAGKPAAHSERDDYIFVGGRTKAIPMKLQEQLLVMDLLAEDRVPFSPQSKLHSGKSMAIQGRLDGKYEAILYSQSEATGNLMDRDWLVRPIAMKMQPSGEPLIVTKLVSTVIPKVITATNDTGVTMDEQGRAVLGYDDNVDLDGRRFPGPHGTTISDHEWYRRTLDGCDVCTRPIDIEDANDIIWVTDTTGTLVPVCGYCDEESHIAEQRSYH